jgi:hypothetical protein
VQHRDRFRVHRQTTGTFSLEEGAGRQRLTLRLHSNGDLPAAGQAPGTIEAIVRLHGPAIDEEPTP